MWFFSVQSQKDIKISICRLLWICSWWNCFVPRESSTVSSEMVRNWLTWCLSLSICFILYVLIECFWIDSVDSFKPCSVQKSPTWICSNKVLNHITSYTFSDRQLFHLGFRHSAEFDLYAIFIAGTPSLSFTEQVIISNISTGIYHLFSVWLSFNFCRCTQMALYARLLKQSVAVRQLKLDQIRIENSSLQTFLVSKWGYGDLQCNKLMLCTFFLFYVTGLWSSIIHWQHCR